MAESKRSKASRGGSKKAAAPATGRQPADRRSPSGGDNDGEGNMPKAQEAQTGGMPMGRPPADEPDVYVYVPKVKVGELCVDVERLEAHLALRTQVANLVNLVAGVHVAVDTVKIDLKDVEAEAELKVRLENTYNILDRTLTTLDENPQVVEKLLDTADTAVQETGQIGREATRPGGAVSELGSGLTNSVGNLTGTLGDSLSSAAQKASPKRLLSGNGGNGSRSSAASNGSGAGRTAAMAGAAGLAGLLGSAFIGSGSVRLRRRGPLERVVDRLRS
jgi:hypothetical protein